MLHTSKECKGEYGTQTFNRTHELHGRSSLASNRELKSNKSKEYM